MNLISWILFGSLLGITAATFDKNSKGGLIGAITLGILGALTAGVLANGGGIEPHELNTTSLVLGIIGSFGLFALSKVFMNIE